MDSEGIWKAWMINVMTKTAITTVLSSDCSEINQPECGVFPIAVPARNVLCRAPCCPHSPTAKRGVPAPAGPHPAPHSSCSTPRLGPQTPVHRDYQPLAAEPQP